MKNKPIIRNGIAGYETCPRFLKEAYLRAVKECQMCHKEKALEPHRIIGKREGGLYTVCPIGKKGSNVKMLCNDCHKLIHSNEFPHVSNYY